MAKPHRIGVIADDLTGGASIAGELVREGWPCEVLGMGRAIPSAVSVVVETGTRFEDPGAAASVVRRAVESLTESGFTLMMKKIDSSLKGNAVAEIAAYAGSVEGRVVVSPACPAVGTSVVAGVVLQRGKRGTDIVATLGEATIGAVRLLPLATVRNGARAVAGWLREHGEGIIVADAETQDDLDALCSGALRSGTNSFAGSYGMGAALARASGERGAPGAARAAAPRVVVLVGSASERAQQQVENFVAAGALELALDVHVLLDGSAHEESLRVRDAVAGSDPRDVIVHTATATTRGEITARRSNDGLTERELARAFAAPMAAALHAAPGAAIVLVGGETAGAIIELLGVDHLTVLAELQPAVPLCRAETGDRRTLVTKPGSFGEVSALVEISRALRS